MTSSVRVVMNPEGVKKVLNDPRIQKALEERAAAIAKACNAESSWGGYESGPVEEKDTARANVWTIGDHDDEARQQRLVKNLDAGR